MRLWDVATALPIGPLLQHENDPTCLAFSPDGGTAATGSLDKTARLWRLSSGAAAPGERLVLWAEVSRPAWRSTPGPPCAGWTPTTGSSGAGGWRNWAGRRRRERL